MKSSHVSLFHLLCPVTLVSDCFLFTLIHACPVYMNGNVKCIFKHVGMDGDYSRNSGKTAIWTNIVLKQKLRVDIASKCQVISL